jgi:cytoskeletal protein RodZ
MSKLLKKQREDLGRDIKEIAAHTRIKESCLRSIEAEDYDKVPPEVYTRGYIKEYAKYLGMPIEPALAPYEKYLEVKAAAKGKKEAHVPETPESLEKIDKQPLAQKEEQRQEIRQEVKISLETPQADNVSERAGKRGNRPLWTGLLLMIVMAGVIYQFIASRNSEKEPYIAPIVPQEQLNKELSQPQGETLPKPDSQSTPAIGDVNSPEKQIVTHKKHILEITASDTAWVKVVMDGLTNREALMKQGDNAVYEANETVTVVVGNAGGVKMKFDGGELPVGKKGEVLRMTLPERKTTGPQSDPVADPTKNIQKPASTVNREVRVKIPKDNTPLPLSGKPDGASQP